MSCPSLHDASFNRWVTRLCTMIRTQLGMMHLHLCMMRLQASLHDAIPPPLLIIMTKSIIFIRTTVTADLRPVISVFMVHTNLWTGQSNEIFYLHFFIIITYSVHTLATDQWVKIFSQSYLNFTLKNWSPGYDTPDILTRRDILPRGDWLAGVWYPPGPGWLTRRGHWGHWKIGITRRIQNQNYFNPLVSGPSRFKFWKKSGGQKSRWTVPLIWIHL